jgi:hypothetical protein
MANHRAHWKDSNFGLDARWLKYPYLLNELIWKRKSFSYVDGSATFIPILYYIKTSLYYNVA